MERGHGQTDGWKVLCMHEFDVYNGCVTFVTRPTRSSDMQMHVCEATEQNVSSTSGPAFKLESPRVAFLGGADISGTHEGL